ncbi:MAG: gamma-glutamyltransferase [bacterium]|nr:gamma-glutamyltransferase [bacterium]
MYAVGAGWLLIAVALGCGGRELIAFDDPTRTPRRTLEASEYAVVAGTPWAAEAMDDVLARGGNAFDAAVAGLLVLNVTFGEAASFPSIAPLLVWDATAGEASSYVGVGTAPAAATIEAFRARGHEVVPARDVIAQLVPASPDVIVELLQRHGTRPFGELAAPAIEIAEAGFAIHATTARNLDLSWIERLGMRLLLPYNAKVFTQGEWWKPIRAGERLRRVDLSKTLAALARTEAGCLEEGGEREVCLEAVRERFYEGDIAEAIVALHEAHDGFMTAEDLAGYAGKWEAPLRARFGGYELLSNGTWTQGIALLMAAQILDGVAVDGLEHNSARYVHTLVQALELAMADREAYAGDPDFVDVPLGVLLSEAFAAKRRAEMGSRAFGALPPPGDVPGDAAWRPASPTRHAFSAPPRFGRDTTYLAVVDGEGNSVSMTPSDFPVSPMVPDTGLVLGIRMTQFRLDPESPTALAPGKRPRVTPHAAMLLRDGRHVMSFGTPGAEMQTQANLQVLLNHLVFEMGIQEAIDQPRFRSLTWPDSFSPHDSEPGMIELEATLYDAIADDLEALGYRVRRWDDWDPHFSAVGAIRRRDDGTLAVGADPREATTAKGR